jgi:hypothetical protein
MYNTYIYSQLHKLKARCDALSSSVVAGVAGFTSS